MVHWRWITLLTSCFAIRQLDARTIQKMFLCNPSFTNQNITGKVNCSLSVTGPDSSTGIQALAFSAGNNSAGGANMINLVQSGWTIQNGSYASASSVNNASGHSPSVQSSVSASGSSGSNLSGIGILNVPSINSIVNELLLNLNSNFSRTPTPVNRTPNVGFSETLVHSSKNGTVPGPARIRDNSGASKATVLRGVSSRDRRVIHPHSKASPIRTKSSKIMSPLKAEKKQESTLRHQETAIVRSIRRHLKKKL